MKSLRPGFLLIELSVYIGLALFLSWLVVSFTARRIMIMSGQQQTAQRLVHIHSSLSSLKRIVDQFNRSNEYWKVRSSKEMIVARSAQEDVGLLLESDKLWYLSGYYSKKSNQWIKKNKSLLLDQVQDGRFEVQTTTLHPITVQAFILKAELRLPNKKNYSVEQWHAIRGAGS